MSKYNYLADIVINDRVSGTVLSVDDSIDRAIKESNFALEELADGEWNGMAIKDASHIPAHYEAALKPILEVSAAILNTVSQNKEGWANLSVEFEDRAALGGQHTVKLKEHEVNLSEAVHNWLDAVEKSPCVADIGKPLAVNSEARGRGALNSLSEVLRLTTEGWQPKPFVSDTQSQSLLAKSTADLASGLGQRE